jgi:tetratricopeptide (TPR) repeat protein
VKRRKSLNRLTPVLGLGLLVIGGVVLYRPTESKQVAYETATRVSSKAVELWEAAGWREINQPPTESTRGYRAPQRFAKPSSPASMIEKRDQNVLPAGHDDPASRIEESHRPQVQSPVLAGPGNAPKLRQLEGGSAPKLQPTLSSQKPAEETATAPAEALDAKAGLLNAPEVRKVRNPFATKASDEGQTKTKTEKALLEAENGSPKEPSRLPLSAVAEEDAPVGSGVVPEKLPQSARPMPSNPSEKSVLKKSISVIAPHEGKSDSGLSKVTEGADGAQEKRRRPFTAILHDVAPSARRAETGKSNSGSEGNASSDAAENSETPNEEVSREPLDHHASNFHGVTPGITTEMELLKELGEPVSSTTEGEIRLLRFGSETFKAVEVAVVGGIAEAITLQMHKPLPTSEIIKELGLSSFEPGLVTSSEGYVLGQAYPERGVVLQFAQSENGVAEVDQIVLERVQAEPFLLRALDEKNHRYASAFQDLDVALKLDPEEPRALWLKASLLCETGRHVSALRAIDDAIRLDASVVGYRITRARILLALGKHGEASRIIDSILVQGDLAPEVKARALCLEGELAACGPAPDFEQGLASFRSAIQEASTVADDGRPAVRRLARRVLVESHLGVARCIAWGRLAEAEKAAAQWNERARLLAETAISDEDLSDDVWLTYHRSVMSTHLGLAAKSNSDRDISELQLDYKRLLSSASDEMYRDRLKWEFAIAFTDASRLESARGKHRAASQHAEMAWNLMAEGIRGREGCDEDEFVRGMLLYQLGSIAAVAKENHPKAVEWYSQAIGLLEKPLPESLESQKGIRGLAFVGMGASFWETGDQKRALALSEMGAKALQEAAAAGQASDEALGLAFGNLESMYRDLGDTASADRVARLASEQENSPILR